MRSWMIGLIMFVSSCATSYQPDGFAGGYSDRKVGRNKYMVSFRGNGYTSQKTVEGYAHRRAEEICLQGGFEGYELLNQDDDRYETNTGSESKCTGYQNNVSCRHSPGIVITKSSVTLMFSCYPDTERHKKAAVLDTATENFEE
jgi:hypothetical protein